MSRTTRIFMFYRVGVVKWAVLFKKILSNGHWLVFINEDLSHVFMDISLNHPNPCPQKLSVRGGG